RHRGAADVEEVARVLVEIAEALRPPRQVAVARVGGERPADPRTRSDDVEILVRGFRSAREVGDVGVGDSGAVLVDVAGVREEGREVAGGAGPVALDVLEPPHPGGEAVGGRMAGRTVVEPLAGPAGGTGRDDR